MSAGWTPITSLGCAAILAVFVTRTGDSAMLIDLGALMADMRAAPHAYWWLYATFFSTLIPTALHLLIGCTALADSCVTWSVRRANADLLTALENNDVDFTLKAVRWLALGQTVGLVLTVLALWILLWALLTHGLSGVALMFAGLEGVAVWLLKS